tara:strand:- start:4022 stop:4261 length:240 start_codon:yes stop_codon:yes gene_type:complete
MLMLKLVDLFLNLYSFALLAHVVMTWFKVEDNHPFKLFIGKIVNPVLEPVKKVLPPFNGIDFSVVAVLILIQIVRNFLF